MATTTVETATRGEQTGVTIRDLASRAVFAAIGAVERGIEALRVARRERQTMAALRGLSDDMLDDIGLTRADIGRISHDR